MTDTEHTEIGTGDGAELANAPDLAHEAQIARDAERDAKLDASVRRAAEQAYSRPDHDRVMEQARRDGDIDATIRASWEQIQARPPELTMPPLPGNPTIEQTLAEQEKWARMSPSDQWMQSHAFKEVEAMKAAAEHFGIKVETASDLQALRQLTGQQQQSSAPSPVWGRLGIGDEIRGDAEGLQRLNDFADRHAATFQRNGISMAQGLELLMQAQNMLETDPQNAINWLAQAYGVSPQAIPEQGAQERQAAQITLHEWMQTKQNITPELRIEMANIIQEPSFKADGPTLNMLNAAYAEAKRRAAQRGKRSLDSKMDETLTRKHREIRGRR